MSSENIAIIVTIAGFLLGGAIHVVTARALARWATRVAEQTGSRIYRIARFIPSVGLALASMLYAIGGVRLIGAFRLMAKAKSDDTKALILAGRGMESVSIITLGAIVFVPLMLLSVVISLTGRRASAARNGRN